MKRRFLVAGGMMCLLLAGGGIAWISGSAGGDREVPERTDRPSWKGGDQENRAPVPPRTERTKSEWNPPAEEVDEDTSLGPADDAALRLGFVQATGDRKSLRIGILPAAGLALDPEEVTFTINLLDEGGGEVGVNCQIRWDTGGRPFVESKRPWMRVDADQAIRFARVEIGFQGKPVERKLFAIDGEGEWSR